MEATLTEATRPAILAAAEHLAAIVREPGPVPDADVQHLDAAAVEALAEQLHQSRTVSVEPETFDYAARDALVCLADQLNPAVQSLEEVKRRALAIATLVGEIERMEYEAGRETN